MDMQETTLFLQMLYDPKFKQQYSEELMDHYQMMLESVTEKIVRNDDPLVRHFKALDSSLDRGIPTCNFPAEGIDKNWSLLQIVIFSHDSAYFCSFNHTSCLLQLWCNFSMFPIWS